MKKKDFKPKVTPKVTPKATQREEMTSTIEWTPN